MRVGYHNSIQKTINIKWYSVIITGILLSLQYIIISVDADPSLARWGHASALINNRLYVYGGRLGKSKTVETTNVNELLSLDVSKPFDPTTPPWEVKSSLLPSNEATPFLSFHSCSMGGNQNELLIVFGGESRDQELVTDNSLFVYNTTTEAWLNPPVTTNNAPSRRIDHTIVPISNSIAYLWGGTPVGDGENVNALNDLYKLTSGDTILWELSGAQGPVGRWGHSATLLNDGKMYIIGGLSAGNFLASMTEIPVFDTKQEIWTTKTATGDTIPAQRRGHRAVGTADNRIIIFGGTTAGFDTNFDDVAVLNVTGDALTWEIHQVTGKKPPGRFDHSMTLVGSKAIITYGFGDDYIQTTGTKLFVLDTNSYTWDQTYDPSPITPGTQNPGTQNPDSTTGSGTTSTVELKTTPKDRKLGIIVGVPVAVGVLILVLAGLLFFWIRKRNKKSSFSATPYEKQQASVPPIAGPVPLYNLSNRPSSPTQGGAGGTTNNAPFIPPFATSSYQRRQPSVGSLSEKRNLTPVDQHDSWGSAPSNSSQSQLPQINPYYETSSYYKPTTSRPTSPLANPNVYYSPQTPPPQHHYSNISPTPPPSSPTPPPVSPQKDTFTSSTAPITSSSTKTSSTNLRLDSDSNTAPAEHDFNLPPVAPLSINRTRTPSPSQIHTQEQQQPQQQQQQQLFLSTPQLPISTTSSSSSLLQEPSDVISSSPIEIEPTETTSTEDEGGVSGLFNSPLFRTEALSALAGTAAAASPNERTLSLRSVPRINTSTPRNSTNISSPPPTSAGSRFRSGAFEGRRTYDGNVTGGSRPTSPTDNNTSDNQPPGRLFVANPDPTDDSD